jgi:hypothetical protein
MARALYREFAVAHCEKFRLLWATDRPIQAEMTMSTEGSGPVVRDAVQAFSIAGRIVNYLFLAVFVLGLSIIGIASFVTGTGTTGHRFAASLGYVAFFGIGFGLLFLSQWLARQVLFMFFNVGVAALSETPGKPAAGDGTDNKADGTAKHVDAGKDQQAS